MAFASKKNCSALLRAKLGILDWTTGLELVTELFSTKGRKMITDKPYSVQHTVGFITAHTDHACSFSSRVCPCLLNSTCFMCQFYKVA